MAVEKVNPHQVLAQFSQIRVHECNSHISPVTQLAKESCTQLLLLCLTNAAATTGLNSKLWQPHAQTGI